MAYINDTTDAVKTLVYNTLEYLNKRIDGIASKNAFAKVKTGSTSAAADAAEDTVEFVGSRGVTISASGDTVTFTGPDLSSYATTAAVNSTLSSYPTKTALTSTLSSYVTNTALTSTLSSYVTTANQTSTLSNYVLKTGLTSTLSSYVTNTALTTTLSSYATNSALSNKQDASTAVTREAGKGAGGATTPIFVGTDGKISAGTALKGGAYVDVFSGALAATTTATTLATAKQVVDYVGSSMVSVLKYKGTVNATNGLPATHKQGDVYVVQSAGTFAGKACEAGDYIICNADGTAANNAHWDVVTGENQVTNSAATLSFGTSAIKIANVDGTDITVTMPSVPAQITYSLSTGASNGQVQLVPSSGTAINATVKGINNAAYKDVATSIGAASTATTLPTCSAVAAFVEGKQYLTSYTESNDFGKVIVGTTTATAASKGDSLTVAASGGASVSLSGKTLTISAPVTPSAVTTAANGLMTAADKVALDAAVTKLAGIDSGANAYVHPTSDGAKHVPATGTSNANKVLVAGSTAGSLSWKAVSDVYTPPAQTAITVSTTGTGKFVTAVASSGTSNHTLTFTKAYAATSDITACTGYSKGTITYAAATASDGAQATAPTISAGEGLNVALGKLAAEGDVAISVYNAFAKFTKDNGITGA